MTLVQPRNLALLFMIAAFLPMLFLTGCGGADSGADTLTPEELEQRRAGLVRIASLKDPAKQRSELRAYLAENPEGPNLDAAYQLLMSNLAASAPSEAGELAEEILKKRTAPEEADLRLIAYRHQLESFQRKGETEAAIALARSILANERYAATLQMASRYDPGNRAAFDKKIQQVLEEEKERLRRERYAELLDLEPDQWEEMVDSERKTHLARTINRLEQLPSNSHKDERLTTLYTLLVSMLIQSGEGRQALAYLDRMPPAENVGAWAANARGNAHELLGEFEAALKAYVDSFVMQTDRQVWESIRRLAQRRGEPPSRYSDVIRASLIERGRVFPSFELKTPEGKTRTLADYVNEAVLVIFFFPG